MSRNYLRASAATVRGTPEVFLRIRANMLRRPEACIVSQGQHFQHLLKKVVAF